LPEAGLWPTPTTAQKKRARHMKAKEATGRITKTVQQQWGDSRQKPPTELKQKQILFNHFLRAPEEKGKRNLVS